MIEYMSLELSFDSMGLSVGSWSPMIFHWLFCIQQYTFLSACGECREVVIEFE